ncbi:hypothetical protein BD626DRAFT_484114 [Schizophyllum amplum]|uniref:Uncharacterized protein n=1 Tax=Schizophyllum amplum TaxID=97359 RepID=A0A550CQ14_9AGAR|nr:hypothetical protein BD626DRAFT_484114 [Auriculariopsis ampla]
MVLRTLKADTENKAPSGLRRSRADAQKRRRVRDRHAIGDAAKVAHKRTSLPKVMTTSGASGSSADQLHDQTQFRPSSPINDVEMADATAPTVPTTPVQLPRHLRRPRFPPVTEEALTAVGEVTNGPFVRSALDEMGEGMLRAAQSVHVPCSPSSSIPNELAVIVNSRAAPAPTHMLAVHGPPPPDNAPRKVQLLPIHASVLAAHCSRLPPFENVRENVIQSVPAALSLPVRPISLPVPAMFSLLLGYLYVRDVAGLLQALVPERLPPMAATDADFPINEIARRLAHRHPPSVLIAHVGRVHGLWQDTCALGINDDGLWAAMQLAWQVLLTAVAIGTRAREDMYPVQGGRDSVSPRPSASPRPACNGVASQPVPASP